MKRITDLEEFSLHHIWRPYQSKMGYAARLDRPPYNLNETARLLGKDSEWSRLVLDRVKAIGFSFPAYIQHPLIDVVRKAQEKGGCHCPSFPPKLPWP